MQLAVAQAHSLSSTLSPTWSAYREPNGPIAGALSSQVLFLSSPGYLQKIFGLITNSGLFFGKVFSCVDAHGS
jgi:hypothetical protein